MNDASPNLPTRRNIVRQLTFAAAVLGASAWFGLLTPVSWRYNAMNGVHVGIALGAFVYGHVLRRKWKLSRSVTEWAVESPAIILGADVVATLSCLVMNPLALWIIESGGPREGPILRKAVPSPNRNYTARCYDLGPGFGGGSNVRVTVTRWWLPGIIEDMGTYFSDHRSVESGVVWSSDSALTLSVGERNETLSPKMFASFPSPYLTLPYVTWQMYFGH